MAGFVLSHRFVVVSGQLREDREQRTEDRQQKADNRGQISENRKQLTEGSSLLTVFVYYQPQGFFLVLTSYYILQVLPLFPVTLALI